MRIRCAVPLLLLGGIATGCDEPAAPVPPPNVVVTIEPEVAGAFASLGETIAFRADLADTLGNPISGTIAWDVRPASAAVTVAGDGMVTVLGSATPGDYRVSATTGGARDTAVVHVLPRPSGRMVFTATVGTSSQVFVKDFAIDGDAMQLTATPGTIAGLAVDPASSTIFFSKGTLPNVDVFRMAIDGTALVNLTNDVSKSNQGPTLDPVSGDVFFTRQGLTSTTTQVFRMCPDGTGLAQVTSGTQGKVAPAVSPDGMSLAYSEVFQPGNNIEVVTAGLDGADPVRVTDRMGVDGNAFWMSNRRVAWGMLGTGPGDVVAVDVLSPGPIVNLTNGQGSSALPSQGCVAGTLTIRRTRDGRTDAYQLDLGTGLAVRYALPVERVISWVRRQC